MDAGLVMSDLLNHLNRLKAEGGEAAVDRYLNHRITEAFLRGEEKTGKFFVELKAAIQKE